MNNSINERINNISAEWNPLRVEVAVAKDEYKEYVPTIIAAINEWDKLKCCIEHILKTMGIEYTQECVDDDIE